VRADVKSSISEHKFKYVGIITSHQGQDSWKWDSFASTFDGDVKFDIFPIGDERTDLAAVEHGLFDALRTLDERHVDAIFLEGVSECNQGLAIMNRAKKASSSHIDVSSLL